MMLCFDQIKNPRILKECIIKLLLIRYFIEILDTDYVDEYLEAKVIILLASEA
jgi:hypothetical protein